MNINELLGQDYLKKYKITTFLSLFPPDWKNLKSDRCIYCGIKLHIPVKRNIVICPSKKHSKFFMSFNSFITIKNKINANN